MIEIRTINNLQIDQIQALSKKYNVEIGLGSECCIHKLPSPERVRMSARMMEGLTLVTPITPQKHYNRLLEYIEQLPQGIRLVVNDPGILYSLYNSGTVDSFDHIIAGRGIVHTSEACPWVDHLLRDESEHIREAFLQTNFNCSRTLGLFKGLGISAIETDLESKTIKAACKIGLPVGAHFEYIAVSYARSCHTARFFGEQPPKCDQRCNTPIKLELVDMFDLGGTPPGFAQPSKEMMDIYPDLYLLGNILFMKSGCMEVQGLERVIINADMYDLEGLEKRIVQFTGTP